NFFNDKIAFIIIGASKDPSKYGHKVLQWYKNQRKPVFVIHPKENEVLGEKCYRSINEIPVSENEMRKLAIHFITPPAVTITYLQIASE
ncbi:hypothetical protein ROZALSC1DRAFT_2223, partial [Rozella allomycis CSF55]